MISSTNSLNNFPLQTGYRGIVKMDQTSALRRKKGGRRGDLSKGGIGKWGAVILLASLLLLPSCSSSKGVLKGDLSTIQDKYLIAVFPFQNLTGTPVPIKEIRKSFINRLEAKGFEILDDGILEKFMAKYRIRDTGGIDWATAQAFKKELGVEGVLITAVELYSDVIPPKIAMTSRLVSTGDKVVILWMDGVGVSGDDSPGILGLGLIEDPIKLLDNALDFLSGSLAQYVSTKKENVRAKHAEKKFKPKIVYRSPMMEEDRKYTVAVIPFFNESMRKNAAEIVVLHFVRELTKLGNFNVLELGVVKQRLLNARIIMLEGISLTDADLVLNSLEADLVITGRVMDYQDYQGSLGKPIVDVSVTAIERKSRKVVWDSYSHNEGDDGVFFFDWGRVNTAHAMMAKMAQAIGEIMTRGK